MHYYNLFVHFYFVKTVHSYFIILKQGGTNRQETVKKTLENPLVTRDLQNFSVCQMGFKS